MSGRRRAFVVGFGAAVAVVALLLVLVGTGDVFAALGSATPSLVVATFALGLCWLAAWSLMLRQVLATLDVEVPAGKAFFVYAGAVFANNVTPFGQAGGEPFAALLVSKVSSARYETGLVGIATVDVVNVVPSISLVLLGVGYYSTANSVGGEVQTAVASALALVATISLLLVLVWRYRDALVARIAGWAAGPITRIRRGATDAVEVEADLAGRMHRFFDHIERLADDPRSLATVVGLSLLGWLFQAAALTVAFAALGHGISPAVAVFVIPLGNVAGAAPLPGGLGGIEAAFVALLVPTTGVAAAAVTAAVLLYRGAIYWMPVVIGGGSVSAFGVRGLS